MNQQNIAVAEKVTKNRRKKKREESSQSSSEKESEGKEETKNCEGLDSSITTDNIKKAKGRLPKKHSSNLI